MQIRSPPPPPNLPHLLAFWPGQMLKRSANELVHQCESGDGGAPTKDLRLCRSCGGSEINVGGGQRGGTASSANSAGNNSKRPGTAPAKIRRCPHGGGAGRPGGGGGRSAEAGKQPVFANLTTSAATDGPCGQQSSSSSPSPSPCSSGCCCRGRRARSNQPTGRNGTSPWGTGRRAQTAARARGDDTSIDNSNAGSSCLAVGGVKKHPARRAQTAGRNRLQSAGAASRCHPSAVTPPPHPRRTPRDGDGGRTEGAVAFAAAASPSSAGGGGGIDEQEPHPSREREGEPAEEELAGHADVAAAEGVTPGYLQQQTTDGGRGEEAEALLAKRSDPSRSTHEAKRPSPDGGSGGNSDPGATRNSAAAVVTVAAETRLTGDVPLEHGEEGFGRESATATADGRAVQVRYQRSNVQWGSLDPHSGRLVPST